MSDGDFGFGGAIITLAIACFFLGTLVCAAVGFVVWLAVSQL